MGNDPYLSQLAEYVDAFQSINDDDLSERVVRHGSCMGLYEDGDGPRLIGDPAIDRESTAPICVACPVRLECLEWEMRSVGSDTRGPWGYLSESDRREFHDMWAQRRGIPTEVPDGLQPGGGEW